jgi:Protein of unknown function (DUF3768)
MSKKKERSARIAALNDDLRKDPSRPRWMLTAGVNAEGLAFVAKAIAAVRAFDAFTKDNDPHHEHDFASVKVAGIDLFWKVDYYEKGSDYSVGAETPENSATTDRVLTIMLVDEY